jgi:hypothetical protein
MTGTKQIVFLGHWYLQRQGFQHSGNQARDDRPLLGRVLYHVQARQARSSRYRCHALVAIVRYTTPFKFYYLSKLTKVTMDQHSPQVNKKNHEVGLCVARRGEVGLLGDLVAGQIYAMLCYGYPDFAHSLQKRLLFVLFCEERLIFALKKDLQVFRLTD